jgi:hypothetical protein
VAVSTRRVPANGPRLLGGAALTVAAVVVCAALAPAAAVAAQPCGKQVFLDWWDNYRIDRIYELHCYRDAIEALPVDIRQYSEAEDDISRALAYALQHKPDPGDQGEGPAIDRSDGDGPAAGEQPAPSSMTPPPPADTAGPAAVPLPLVVLASLACLLLVLGAAGYLKRRLAGRGGLE